MNINVIPNIKYTGSGNFFLIAGPCVVENTEMPFEIAEKILAITTRLKIPFIFKSSYKKANRTNLKSFSGIGDIPALEIIQQVGRRLKIPTITDIHNENEAILAGHYVDVIQIPAFLSRQTELLMVAAKTDRVINVKKGQFASAGSMKFVIEKLRASGNNKVMLTERGTTFGYDDLIVDFRNITEMKGFNVPVVLDITHSLQQPNRTSGTTGGKPQFIETIAKAGVAAGADGIFLETHPKPQEAKSDGENMLKLDLLEDLLEKLVKIRKAI